MSFVTANLDPTILALGLLLLELCFDAPFDSLRIQDDTIATGGVSNVLTDIITANRLLQDVSDMEGDYYSNAVRRCIRCDFDQHTNSLSDDNFREAVYELVVCELDTALQNF